MTECKHENLNIRKGSLQICPNFVLNDGLCSDSQCTCLHVCRAWLAGCCKSLGYCVQFHSLRTPHNTVVLQRSGVFPLPLCEENIRMAVQHIFPQLCPLYSLNVNCPQRSCSKLHLCKEFLLSGQCLNVGCSFSHNFASRERRILSKSGIELSPDVDFARIPPRQLRQIFVNVLCPDGPYVKLCKSHNPRIRRRLRKSKIIPNSASGGEVASVANDSAGSSENEDDEDTESNNLSQAYSRASSFHRHPRVR
jgi:hypothetical protein